PVNLAWPSWIARSRNVIVKSNSLLTQLEVGTSRSGRSGCKRPAAAVSKRLTELIAGAFVDLGVDLFAAQHGVKTLDGGNADAADAVELRALEVLNVVKLGELAAVVGRDELLEFFQGLVAEVATVDQEEDAARADELD